MRARYRVTKLVGYRSSTHSLSVRRYAFGVVPYWDTIDSGTEREIDKLLADLVAGDYEPKYFNAEGTEL